MGGTVADFVSKQSGSLWREARKFRNRPPVGCYCFLSLKVYYRDSCPFRLLVWLEQMTFVSSWIVALPRMPAVQPPESPLKIISTNRDYITTTNSSLQLLHVFWRCLQGWRLIPCPQVFTTRIQEIPKHIGIGMMKQLDFLLCTKEREKIIFENLEIIYHP